MWNPFKKKPSSGDPTDPKNMGMLSRFAYKRFQKMKPEEQQKVIQKAMEPKNIEKNKDAILEQMRAMLHSGKISRAQFDEARKRLEI